MGIKRDLTDDLFSKVIRLRSGDPARCEKCGIQSEDIGDFDCSHIITRRYTTGGLRWNPDNANCLCRSCHKWFTDHPAEFGRWLISYLGEGHLDLLQERLRGGCKVTKAMKKEIRKHYRSEIKRVETARMDGFTGYFEIVPAI
jgi:hypothetical protein